MTMTHKEALARANSAYLWPPSIAGNMQSAIHAYIEARGLVLVPREATDAMLISGASSRTADERFETGDDTLAPEWQAMLAAAPDPFEEGE